MGRSPLPLLLPPRPSRAPPAQGSPSRHPFPGCLPRTPELQGAATRGHFLSGWHTIYMPDCQPLTVLCDMDMDGGGWTVSTGTSGTAVWSLGTPQTRLCARGRAVSGGLSLL